MGYGIYITDRRVIGIKKPDQFAKAVGVRLRVRSSGRC